MIFVKLRKPDVLQDYIPDWFEARVSHIPCAKSVLAMVAKAGAVHLVEYFISL